MRGTGFLYHAKLFALRFLQFITQSIMIKTNISPITRPGGAYYAWKNSLQTNLPQNLQNQPSHHRYHYHHSDQKIIVLCNVPVKSKLQHPPPGHTPGI